jgi:broad specificity phosphatase PhoE
MSTPEELSAIYAGINAELPAQLKNYAAWLESGAVDKAGLIKQAAALGLVLDVDAGTIAYGPTFEKPSLPFELWYCRHGKTGGNTEPRVYQGYVDEPFNALNEIGCGQAVEAADKMAKLGVEPDLVVLSPLSRAADTGMAFCDRVKGIQVEKWESAAEMRFGGWDNKRVKDMPKDSICHLFYLTQNTVVKSSEEYVNPSTGAKVAGENFVEVLTRTAGLIAELREKSLKFAKRPDGKKNFVIVYGHSMAGAALSILTGNGKQVDGQAFLGFDGKYIMPNATPVCLCE